MGSFLGDVTGIGSVANLFDGIINKIWPDKTKQEEAKAAFAQAELAGELQGVQNDFSLALEQIKVNAVEAASADPYTSRWRPTMGYIACAGLGWNFIMHPLLSWGAAIFDPTMPIPPLVDANMLKWLVGGMLGIGTLRTVEKIRGVTK